MVLLFIMFDKKSASLDDMIDNVLTVYHGTFLGFNKKNKKRICQSVGCVYSLFTFYVQYKGYYIYVGEWISGILHFKGGF